MRPDITWAILTPAHDQPLGYIRSSGLPSLEAMADHLAIVLGFEDRDHFLHVNPGVLLAAAPLH